MGKVRSGINYDERFAGARKLGVMLGFRGLACEGNGTYKDVYKLLRCAEEIFMNWTGDSR